MNKRGGYFPHAERWGRKSVWQNLPTALIRVPSTLIDKILNYAHIVDSGKDYERQIILKSLDQFIESQRQHAGGNQHKPAGELRIETSVYWRKLIEFKRWIEST